jgi:transcriptional regulator with XRE-family HTH domain
MVLSDKLKQLRDERNWSQRFVANLMNVHRTTISKYESGQITPSYQALNQLANIYKIDASELISELGESVPAPTQPYVLNENNFDHDMDLIKQLVDQSPDLKKALLELYNLDEKTQKLAIQLFQAQMQIMKKR